MRWWRRVNYTLISKYWWSVYWRMFQWCQYLFYFVNIIWIMDWSNVCRVGWNGLIWVRVILINVNQVEIFFILIYNWVGLIPIYRIFANFFNIEIIFRSAFLKILLPLRFYTSFSLSFLIVPYHGKTLITESKILQLISMVLVTCGRVLLMVFDGFIVIFSSTFLPKSTLISLPLFRLPNRKSQSPFLRLSMEVLAWLASTMILSPNCALYITRSFDSIVTADNERCSVLVRLVSVDWSIVEVDTFLAVFIPNGVVSDIDSCSIFLIQVSKYFSVPDLNFCFRLVQLFFSCQLFCSQFVQFYWSLFVRLFCSCLVQSFCSKLYSGFPFFLSKGILWSSWLSSSLPIFSSVCNVIEMCSTLFQIRFLVPWLATTATSTTSYLTWR